MRTSPDKPDTQGRPDTPTTAARNAAAQAQILHAQVSELAGRAQNLQAGSAADTSSAERTDGLAAQERDRERAAARAAAELEAKAQGLRDQAAAKAQQAQAALAEREQAQTGAVALAQAAQESARQANERANAAHQTYLQALGHSRLRQQEAQQAAINLQVADDLLNRHRIHLQNVLAAYSNANNELEAAQQALPQAEQLANSEAAAAAAAMQRLSVQDATPMSTKATELATASQRSEAAQRALQQANTRIADADSALQRALTDHQAAIQKLAELEANLGVAQQRAQSAPEQVRSQGLETDRLQGEAEMLKTKATDAENAARSVQGLLPGQAQAAAASPMRGQAAVPPAPQSPQSQPQSPQHAAAPHSPRRGNQPNLRAHDFGGQPQQQAPHQAHGHGLPQAAGPGAAAGFHQAHGAAAPQDPMHGQQGHALPAHLRPGAAGAQQGQMYGHGHGAPQQAMPAAAGAAGAPQGQHGYGHGAPHQAGGVAFPPQDQGAAAQQYWGIPPQQQPDPEEPHLQLPPQGPGSPGRSWWRWGGNGGRGGGGGGGAGNGGIADPRLTYTAEQLTTTVLPWIKAYTGAHIEVANSCPLNPEQLFTQLAFFMASQPHSKQTPTARGHSQINGWEFLVAGHGVDSPNHWITVARNEKGAWHSTNPESSELADALTERGIAVSTEPLSVENACGVTGPLSMALKLSATPQEPFNWAVYAQVTRGLLSFRLMLASVSPTVLALTASSDSLAMSSASPNRQLLQLESSASRSQTWSDHSVPSALHTLATHLKAANKLAMPVLDSAWAQVELTAKRWCYRSELSQLDVSLRDHHASFSAFEAVRPGGKFRGASALWHPDARYGQGGNADHMALLSDLRGKFAKDAPLQPVAIGPAMQNAQSALQVVNVMSRGVDLVDDTVKLCSEPTVGNAIAVGVDAAVFSTLVFECGAKATGIANAAFIGYTCYNHGLWAGAKQFVTGIIFSFALGEAVTLGLVPQAAATAVIGSMAVYGVYYASTKAYVLAANAFEVVMQPTAAEAFATQQHAKKAMLHAELQQQFGAGFGDALLKYIFEPILEAVANERPNGNAKQEWLQAPRFGYTICRMARDGSPLLLDEDDTGSVSAPEYFCADAGSESVVHISAAGDIVKHLGTFYETA